MVDGPVSNSSRRWIEALKAHLYTTPKRTQNRAGLYWKYLRMGRGGGRYVMLFAIFLKCQDVSSHQQNKEQWYSFVIQDYILKS